MVTQPSRLTCAWAAAIRWSWLAAITVPSVIPGVSSAVQAREKVLAYLKGLGRGSYLFGRVGTWVHNENPDLDHPSNWLHKVQAHAGRLPRYGCITYDFVDDPFPDAAWNEGVQKLWNRRLIVGVYSFFANPGGGACVGLRSQQTRS